MEVRIQATKRVGAPRSAVFERTAAIESIARLFHGHGLIPRTERAEWLTDDGPRVGARRTVFNSDGSQVVEEIVEFDPPRAQAYELIDGLRPPFRWLVRSASGRWTYEEDVRDHTLVTWSFCFRPTTVFVWPLVTWIARSFRRAMEDALERLDAEFECAEKET